MFFSGWSRGEKRTVPWAYAFYNSLVYCISQNQVLGQSVNINMLRHISSNASMCWWKVYADWSKTKTGGAGLLCFHFHSWEYVLLGFQNVASRQFLNARRNSFWGWRFLWWTFFSTWSQYLHTLYVFDQCSTIDTCVTLPFICRSYLVPFGHHLAPPWRCRIPALDKPRWPLECSSCRHTLSPTGRSSTPPLGPRLH